MKIDQLIVQHFFNAKHLTLQEIGTFSLSPNFVLPTEEDKDFQMPENSISFEYNPKATEDQALLSYIMQQTGKMKPLASSDLDSYLTLGKQFLHIGKLLKLDGLGVLEKSQNGQYLFTQGSTYNNKIEAANTTAKDKPLENIISFASNKTLIKPINKNWMYAILVFIGIAIVAAALWHFLINKTSVVSNSNQTNISNKANKKDSSIVNSDTTSKPNSLSNALPSNNSKAYTFKIAFKESNKFDAEAKMKILIARKHKVIMYTKDSFNYILAEPYNLPLSDTTRIKDSLNSYFYSGKGKVVLD